jgi:hypothetical protein
VFDATEGGAGSLKTSTPTVTAQQVYSQLLGHLDRLQ